MPKQSQETTNALNKQNISNLVDNLNALVGKTEENDRQYYVVFMTKADFEDWVRDRYGLLEKVVYGFVALLMLAVVQQIIKVAIK